MLDICWRLWKLLQDTWFELKGLVDSIFEELISHAWGSSTRDVVNAIDEYGIPVCSQNLVTDIKHLELIQKLVTGIQKGDCSR